MKKPTLKSLLLGSLLLTANALTAGEDAAEGPPLPAWQALEFEQKAFMVTAYSRVEVSPLGTAGENSGPPVWKLLATSSVASNSEEVNLQFEAASGQLVERGRLSQGQSDQRYKSYQFFPDHLVRERRNPPSKKTDLAPADWPLSSSREVIYPGEMPAETAVTDAYVLLVLAGRFLASTEEFAEVVVSTDMNLYRVRMTRGEDVAVKVNYRDTGADSKVSGKRTTRTVKLDIGPLGVEDGKPDFSLLGLYGKITMLYDPETGLPVQLRGSAPRVGDAEINLRSATMRGSQG